MSLPIAQLHAWSIACTLMVCVTMFETGDGYAVVTPTNSVAMPTA